MSSGRRRGVDITHQHTIAHFRHSPQSTCALATDRDFVVTTISSLGPRKEMFRKFLSLPFQCSLFSRFPPRVVLLVFRHPLSVPLLPCCSYCLCFFFLSARLDLLSVLLLPVHLASPAPSSLEISPSKTHSFLFFFLSVPRERPSLRLHQCICSFDVVCVECTTCVLCFVRFWSGLVCPMLLLFRYSFALAV